MMFNLTAYQRLLISEFVANGGKIVITEFHTPEDFAKLREKTLINATGYGARALLGDHRSRRCADNWPGRYRNLWSTTG